MLVCFPSPTTVKCDRLTESKQYEATFLTVIAIATGAAFVQNIAFRWLSEIRPKQTSVAV